MAKTMQRIMDERKIITIKNSKRPNAPKQDIEDVLNIALHLEDITLVPLHKLHPYPDHPFKVYSENQMNVLVESIRNEGLQQPIIIRSIDGKPGWEILDGHNRVEAMRHLGKKDIPAIARELDDDQAALVVTTTNLVHREKLLPSEKAFAYKLMIEAYKNRTQANDTNGSADPSTGWTGESSMAYYYIRLTELIPEILGLVDAERIPVKGGVELSYIDQTVQQEILRYMESNGKRLPVKDAEKLRKVYDAGKIVTEATLPNILAKQIRQVKSITLSGKILKRYAIPKDVDLAEIFCAFLEDRYGRA